MDHVIVDGYNVIFAWPDLAAIKDRNLEDAREALVAVLAEYAALTRQRVTVVFDSHRRVEGAASREKVSGVEVVFSGKSSADHVIERLMYDAKNQDEVTVATSDGVQRDMALGKGIKTISALLFRAQVEAARGRRDAQIGDDRARSDLGRRLEDRLDSRSRERLDRIRQPKSDPPKPPG